MDTLFAILLSGMLAGKDIVRADGVTAYFGAQPEISFLCVRAVDAKYHAASARGCHLPRPEGTILLVTRGDMEALRHEVRHVFEGPFHL